LYFADFLDGDPHIFQNTDGVGIALLEVRLKYDVWGAIEIEKCTELALLFSLKNKKFYLYHVQNFK